MKEQFKKEKCSKCDNHINGFCIAENTLKHYSEYLEEKLKQADEHIKKMEDWHCRNCFLKKGVKKENKELKEKIKQE